MVTESDALILSLNKDEIKPLEEENLILGGVMDLEDIASDMEQTVFCLDVSGSMAQGLSGEWQAHGGETKIGLLSKALERYIKNRFEKSSNSKIGVVAFSTKADILIPISSDERAVIRVARELQPQNNTAMHLGLETALGMLKKTSADWIPRIVLLSDGQPDSQEAVVNVIRQYSNMRITVDTIYVGTSTDYNSHYIDFMKELAKITGGVFEQIASEEEFEQKFLKVAERKMLGVGTLDSDKI